MSKLSVLLDPGHGGYDPGAVAYGLEEKNLNLLLALKVAARLGDLKVLLTRERDAFVSLADRVALSRRARPDLFISLHANAGGGRGFESFIYSGLGANDPAVGMQGLLHEEIMATLQRWKIVDRGLKRAAFYVLRHNPAPAVLIESLFIDNEREANLWREPPFVEALADGVASGIRRALGLPHENEVGGRPAGTDEGLHAMGEGIAESGAGMQVIGEGMADTGQGRQVNGESPPATNKAFNNGDIDWSETAERSQAGIRGKPETGIPGRPDSAGSSGGEILCGKGSVDSSEGCVQEWQNKLDNKETNVPESLETAESSKAAAPSGPNTAVRPGKDNENEAVEGVGSNPGALPGEQARQKSPAPRTTLYTVQVGAFAYIENARQRLAEARTAGFKDAYIYQKRF